LGILLKRDRQLLLCDLQYYFDAIAQQRYFPFGFQHSPASVELHFSPPDAAGFD
jgi:hypothetical protein